jgi:hypothetical protein
MKLLRITSVGFDVIDQLLIRFSAFVRYWRKKRSIIKKTVILPVVLYGCETWSLTLREEHRLRVFENMVLRKIFGLKRDEATC